MILSHSLVVQHFFVLTLSDFQLSFAGITCQDRLEDILQVVKATVMNENKWIIQKYIGEDLQSPWRYWVSYFYQMADPERLNRICLKSNLFALCNRKEKMKKLACNCVSFCLFPDCAKCFEVVEQKRRRRRETLIRFSLCLQRGHCLCIRQSSTSVNGSLSPTGTLWPCGFTK